MNAASASQKAAKESEKTAEAYMENAKADAKRVDAAVTTVTNTANDLASKLNNLQNPPKELTGETKGALHVLYLDNTEKDITLAEMGADTSAQVSDKVAESLSTAKLYTDQKVASLVGGAPEALDTLKELADADIKIGDITPQEIDGFKITEVMDFGYTDENVDFAGLSLEANRKCILHIKGKDYRLTNPSGPDSYDNTSEDDAIGIEDNEQIKVTYTLL